MGTYRQIWTDRVDLTVPNYMYMNVQQIPIIRMTLMKKYIKPTFKKAFVTLQAVTAAVATTGQTDV